MTLPETTPEPAARATQTPEVWMVWAEDESILGHYTDAVTAKLAAIEFHQEAESPDLRFVYGWHEFGGHLELQADGDDTRLRVSRDKVHGAMTSAPADRPAVLREGADAIDATFTGPGSDRYVRYGADLLRRLADEAQQPEAEAHRTLTEWIAEVLEDDGMWMYLGTGPDRSVAERRRASVTRRHPGAETRTVRKTTTYTVEADEAQQPAPADRGTAAAIDETAATIQAEGAQR